MKIKIDSDLLAEKIKAITRVIQAQVISFEVKDKRLYVSGQSNGNSCSMNVPVSVLKASKNTTFSIQAATLIGAIAKRKEIEIDISENSLVIKASRFEAELIVQQFEPIVVVSEEIKTGSTFKIKEDILKLIAGSLNKIELKPLISQDTINIGVWASKEGTFLTCFDFFQSSYLFDKTVTGNIKFSLPSSTFIMLSKEFRQEQYKMSVNDKELFAYNDNFELSVALPQQEGDTISIDDAYNFYKNLKDVKTRSIKLQTSGIANLLENAKAIYEKSSTFTIEVKGNKAQLKLRSSYGNMDSTVLLEESIDTPLKFTCDFGSFASILSKASSSIVLRVSDRFILFTNKPVVYLLGLHDS